MNRESHNATDRAKKIASMPAQEAWAFLDSEKNANLNVEGVEFKMLPRGTRRGFINPLEIDVWSVWTINGTVWRWTITHSATGYGLGHGLVRNMETAMSEAVCASRAWIHPIMAN